MSQESTSKPPFEKQKGIAHLFAAARYSFQGLSRLSKETAFYHELLAFAAGEVLLIAIGAPVHHWLIFAAFMLMMFAVEAINTAIEEVVDRVSPEYSLAAKHAKDLGSFAVFCVMLMTGGFMLYALVSAFL